MIHLIHPHHAHWLITFALVTVPMLVRAQLVPDGGTKTLNNVDTNIVGNLTIGTNGDFTVLNIIRSSTVTNSGHGYIGFNGGANTNLVVVNGPGSQWTMGGYCYIGYSGAFNHLTVTNGGLVQSAFAFGYIGFNSQADNNTVTVTGAGSLLSSGPDAIGPFYIGYSGSDNHLIITNGGTSINDRLQLGYGNGTSNNMVIVTGTGSLCSNQSIIVGDGGAFNQLIVANGGTARAGSIYLGFSAASSNNTATISGGNVIATNSSVTGVTDVRRGALSIDSGLLRTDKLILTNGAQSAITFIDGTLQTRNTTCSNGVIFQVGDTNGPSTAVFELLGTGTHLFAKGLQINRKAMLTGTGTIIGNVYNDRGKISPGGSLVIGQIKITGNFTNSGNSLVTNFFDLNQTLHTNDTIIGVTNLVYDGVLSVTNLSGSLTNGDGFKLFNAVNYSGAFQSIQPATPGPNLRWNTNTLTTDGTLRVAVATLSVINSVTLFNSTNFILSATNGTPSGTVYVLTATNLALPTTNWTRLKTNTFDALGSVKVTNVISPTEPKRFYRLQGD